MLIEDDGAFMTLQEFDNLLEYSCSMPTGTITGKIWKRAEPYREPHDRWLLGQYIDVADPKKIGIKWREIFIITPLERVAIE